MKWFKTSVLALLVLACLLVLDPLHAAERKPRKERNKTSSVETNSAAAAPLPISPPINSTDVRVVRPKTGEELTVSEGSTFVIGTVPSDQFSLRCNGKLCDVYTDGAFVGFVPIKRLSPPVVINQKTMDAYFEFVAIRDQSKMTNTVYCITPTSPSYKKAATSEKLAQPRIMESTDDRWVAMENDVSADGKPVLNLGKVVFFPKGARISVKEKKADTFLAGEPVENGPLWIPGGEFKETQDSVQTAAMSTEFVSTKQPHATVYTFDTPVPVPVVVEETSDRTTLKLRFLSNPPRAFVFPQPAPIWGFDISFQDGATPKTTVTVKFTPAINKDKPFDGLKIMLDPGHHPDPGAIGPRGTEERALTLLLARQLADTLRAQGAVVTFSREDQPLELSQRLAKFKAANPDMVISLHFNSAGENEDPHNRWGTQTIYLFPHSQPLAKMIHRYLAPTVRGHDLLTVQRNLVVTRFPNCPVALVESTHIIMPDEEKKLLTPDYRDELAKAISDGISNFLLGEGGAKR